MARNCLKSRSSADCAKSNYFHLRLSTHPCRCKCCKSLTRFTRGSSRPHGSHQPALRAERLPGDLAAQVRLPHTSRVSLLLVFGPGHSLRGLRTLRREPFSVAFDDRSELVVHRHKLYRLLPFAATFGGDSRRLLQKIFREIVVGSSRDFRFRR